MSNSNFLRQSLALALLSLSAVALHAANPVLPGAQVPVQGVVGGTEFPDMARATLRQGDFVNVDNLRQMGAGLSKPQVRRLLGNPHFSEGIAGVSRWNYILNFRTGVDSHVTCQYQVNFDRDGGRYVSQTLHWDGPACLDVLNAPAPVAEAPAPAPVAPQVHTLSADALFRFDRAGEADILPQGRQDVAALAASLRAQTGARITVTGHADRLGNADYNQQLSERRAETVRQLLVAEGVDAGSIRAQGRGASQPVTQCDNAQPRDQLIACLRPDRRVEIEVISQR